MFLSRLYYPHIGGVEKHVKELSDELTKKSLKVKIITGKFDDKLKGCEIVDNILVFRIGYPRIKVIGLLYIWFWMFRNLSLIREAEVVHCHDVFIWYLPFRLLFPYKYVYTTFHGWEGIYPVPLKNIFLRKMANKLSKGTISVGRYIERYYKVKANIVTYGAVVVSGFFPRKKKNSIVWIGRLERDTGLLNFIEDLRHNQYSQVDFCGDGSLGNTCSKYGEVHGFVDPRPFLRRAEYCFASGYLSALEGMVYKCKIKVGWNNKLKSDYWRLTPFYKWIVSDNTASAFNWARQQSWEKLTDQYLRLWEVNR